MKNSLLLLGVLCGLTLSCQPEEETDLVAYINPMIGTDSEFFLSNGNTYPAIALPWGMNFWTPQTNNMGNGWSYQYQADNIKGFKQTHQPSPWINDYGAFSIFATTGEPVFDEEQRESWFTHKTEVSQPHYYRVHLASYNTTVEITPTERAAIFRITWPETDAANLIVDAFNKNSSIQIFPGEGKITGYACNNSGGVPENFKNYFVILADKPFEVFYGVRDGLLVKGEDTVVSEHAGAIVRFSTAAGEQIHLKIASSFISLEQAELNLQREIGNRTFDEVMQTGHAAWNEQLQRILVEGGTHDDKVKFYTALYRTMLFPRKFYEIDHRDSIIHYSPYNGTIESGYLFTDNGFWDTFRAVFPLFNIFFREHQSHVMEGLANTYRESGWLPEWASPGHRDCMIGSNSASIIADAYLKGIEIDEIELLYEAMVKNSENEGPLSSVGRLGVDHYNSLGFIPYDVNIRENIARTLEYAYNDFTIWRLAGALNKPQEEIDRFVRRAGNYANVFDPTVNFMRGRNADGTFQSPFRPDKWGDAFTEGCSWHWTWCVFHDIEGLISLMGGEEPFRQKLDSVFMAEPTFDFSYYGFQIHEITEMLLLEMGQYAHGNQPIQHMPYLFNYAGEPWKSQFHVRNIMEKLYNSGPDGLCGDEDNGQTSAWLVLSALGFYPVTPGSGQYVIGSPLFSKATLRLENGKTFVIDARDNSRENVYITGAKLNGRNYNANYLEHRDIMQGGTLRFDMSDQPDTLRGTSPADAPWSMSHETKTPDK